MTKLTDSRGSLNSASSAKMADITLPNFPKYVTRGDESPPLDFGPKRLHYAYSVSLPMIHLTFVSIVQGIALALLLQSFPLPDETALASAGNLVSFVLTQHAYLPYVISGLVVILIWKQFVQASIIYVWPLSTVQIALMLLISLAEVIAFREVERFNFWLLGLGLVGCIGGGIRFNNLLIHPSSKHESESLRRDNFHREAFFGLAFLLLGLLVIAVAILLHAWFISSSAQFVLGTEWLVLLLLAVLVVGIIVFDHRALITTMKDAAKGSDIQVDGFGGVDYSSDPNDGTYSR